MMKTLYLPLKREYFEAVKAGTKQIEYRLYNNYWRKRIEGKAFDRIVLTLGYPKKTDTARRIVRPWRGYEIIPFKHKHFGNKRMAMFAIKVN